MSRKNDHGKGYLRDAFFAEKYSKDASNKKTWDLARTKREQRGFIMICLFIFLAKIKFPQPQPSLSLVWLYRQLTVENHGGESINLGFFNARPCFVFFLVPTQNLFFFCAYPVYTAIYI
eukprot:GEMP01051899.1.p1 GENE.GEMP01051899.1~~GEMP01051899.1.p1  ORF type:complete len:119 (+),score=1.04 GEMP01051899.1:698-1054(+)